ncbi:unnamed protein product [Hapterophycus canaliculatus]
MKERPSSLSGLKANYLRHILDVSPAAPSSNDHTPHAGSRAGCTCRPTVECTCSEAEQYTSDEDCTCGRAEPSWTSRLAPQPPPSETLAQEALGLLSPAEKDEMILQMHNKLRLLSRRVEDMRAASERKVCCQERANRDTIRERMLSEQRLRQGLLQWKHHHPEIAELRLENSRLRADKDQSQRQYLAVLAKLTRTRKFPKTTL